MATLPTLAGQSGHFVESAGLFFFVHINYNNAYIKISVESQIYVVKHITFTVGYRSYS